MSRKAVHRLYGRRRGPRLKPRQLALLERELPRLAVSPDEPGLARPAGLFAPPVEAVWLEIGFGAGEHLLWQARRHPGIGIIGCEPFVNGVAKLVARVHDEALANIRLHHGDARDILTALGPATIARVFLLFPDPWPKTRHHKRRLVNAWTLAQLHRVMVPGGELRFASDAAGYVRWTLREMAMHGGFEWSAESAADWRLRPSDWPPTRYDAKARAAGRAPVYLSFRRDHGSALE